MSEELKLCKCGNKAEMQTSINYCWVECQVCGERTQGYTSYPFAVAEWNDNHTQAAEIVRLRAELEAVRRELAQAWERQLWIPVGERLPDQRMVLWFDGDSGAGEMATGSLDRVRDGRPIVFVFHSRDTMHYISTFTHWRPLPNPPEEA